MPIVVYVLGLAIFSIGTSELMVAGMMSSLSESFNISIGQVGHLISYFAFGVMLPLMVIYGLAVAAGKARSRQGRGATCIFG